MFAIAITLLVLDLKVPTLQAPTPAGLANALGDHWSTYLTFVFSFVTILIMWVNHHRLFQTVRRVDTAILFSNGLLLLLIAVTPFPTALVGAYLTTPAASVACATYAGFFVLADGAYILLWWVAFRQHRADPLHDQPPHPGKRISSLSLVAYLVATAVAFWSPFLSLSICAAFWLAWAFAAHTSRRQGAAS